MITTLALAISLWSYQPPVVVETVERDLSVYSDIYHGRLTADGSTFDQGGLTVADYDLYRKYKQGYGDSSNTAYLRIGYGTESVVAELTDVTHEDYRHRTDLSREVAYQLTGERWGLWKGAKVEVLR